MNENELSIDLAKEEFNLYAIPNLHEIRFNNYTDKIKIPIAINDYPNISVLSFSGKSEEHLYETPDNLEMFIHIKKLTLRSSCDFTEINPIIHLEKLRVVVQNTEIDTKNIIAIFHI